MNSTHTISVPAQLFALLATALVGAASATAAPPNKDITFATVDGHALKLDLFMPKAVKTNAKKPPLVVFIHGGGWRNGSYKRCHTKWLTEYGFAVASVGYRLTDKAIFPAQVHDCKAAIRWLRAHATDYGYDATRIGVAGTSAGGYLALMMGVTGKVSATNNDKHILEGKVGEHLDQSSAVHAIVDYYGPSDFVLRSQNQPSKTESKDGSVYKLLGGPASKNLALAKLASPVFHVTKDDPPLLIIHGEKDTTVKPDQAKRMAETYAKLKLDITFESVPGGGHGGSSYFKGKYREAAVKFLRTHLTQAAHPDQATGASTPESQGVDSSQLVALSKYIREQELDVRAMVMLRRGKLIFEWYSQGVTREHNHNIFSVTKSFVGTLAGIAVDKGHMKKVDLPLSRLLPNETNVKSGTAKGNITAKDLLTMRSGLPQSRGNKPSGPAKKLFDEVHRADDRLALIMNLSMAERPGKSFKYSNVDPQLMLAIIEQTSGQRAKAFADRHLFEPLGFHNVQWVFADGQGLLPGGYGLRLRVIDMAKLGQLYLQHGKWEGKQLLSESWTEQAIRDQTGSGYGYYWWVGPKFKGHHTISAMGVWGQRILLIPDFGVVFAMASNIEPAKLGEAWKTVVARYVVPSIKSAKALPATPMSARALETELNAARRFMPANRDRLPAARRPNLPTTSR